MNGDLLHVLHRAVDALRDVDPAAASVARDLVDALGKGVPPVALGLVPSPRARRDDYIRELAAVVAPGTSPWRAAGLVSTFARRYIASAWRFDQTRDDPPEDAIKALAWRALKCDAGFPTTPRRLYTIITLHREEQDIAA